MHHFLAALYPFFVEDKHAIPLTTRLEVLFRDFSFRGLTIRGPCTSAAANVFARSELDTTTPHRLLWIPTHNDEGVIYFYDVDFTCDILHRHIIRTYESLVIGDSTAPIMPMHDVIVPTFPVMAPSQLLPLSSLQLYACIFTQPMLEAIATFPVHTLVLTGYAFIEGERTTGERTEPLKNAMLINSRVRVLMLSLLSRHPVTINLSQVTELDYLALGGSITSKSTSAAAAEPYSQLIVSTLSDLYSIVEGYRTNVKTLSLLVNHTDLRCLSMAPVFKSLAFISKIILGYNTCGVQCPIRSMQHCISPECMPAARPASAKASDGDDAATILIRLFELCGGKGIRHFALDSEVSKHLENRAFAAFAPYIDTMECEFIPGSKPGTKYLPLNYATVPDFETFSWTDAALAGKESQRLTPLSGKALRVIVIDPRLEWLNASYIVVNRANVVSLPKEGVTLLDEKVQRSMLHTHPPSTAVWPLSLLGY